MIIDEKKEKEGETESKKHRRTTHPFMNIDQLVIAHRMDSDEHQTNA